MCSMKTLTAAIALSSALLGSAYAAEYAPQEFDFSELALEGVAYGIVESVREVPLATPFEHAIRPETASELVIRIDDGRAVTLRPMQMQRFSAGQRVRVVSETRGARVEHE